jgi:hypothetical protein
MYNDYMQIVKEFYAGLPRYVPANNAVKAIEPVENGLNRNIKGKVPLI